MDELEFRRRVMADPNDLDAELKAAMQSPSHQAFTDEMQALDKEIAKALNDVEVPDGLVDRVLFHQTGHEKTQRTHVRYHVALAASVAFAFGIMLGQFNWTAALPDANANTLEQIALQHVNNESEFVAAIDENVTLAQVNAKLAPFGKQLNDLNVDGRVTYVNHCGFGETAAMHLVMKTSKGHEVTVFLVPQASPDMSSFEDDRHKGVVMPMENASLIVVGEKAQPLSPIVDNIRANLSQSI
ncbi:DUF3379 family protein [Thaumasiovibrio subtropicus]|uniref:DUF3379 family protein n=1 Tax=Thaumasiovibrio subtropicus TaxID=1891207 RepID=UPI000B34CEDD|nr:DUF3379 family protein [Thaumasiovibrio subtropicus]